MGERNIPRLLGIIAVVCIAVALLIIAIGMPGSRGTPTPETAADAPSNGESEPATDSADRSPDPVIETPALPPAPAPTLHELASTGDVEAMRELLDSGAALDEPYDGDDPTLTGLTPLMVAARDADAPTLAALLEAGADPNATTERGRTALMHAAAAGSVGRTELLLTAGSPVNAASDDGRTALMFAAESGGPELITLLLDLGADPALRDDAGRTAADLAASRSDPPGLEVAQILREAGRG